MSDFDDLRAYAGLFLLMGLSICDCLRPNTEQDADLLFQQVILNGQLHQEAKGTASIFVLKFHFNRNDTISFIYFQASWGKFSQR